MKFRLRPQKQISVISQPGALSGSSQEALPPEAPNAGLPAPLAPPAPELEKLPPPEPETAEAETATQAPPAEPAQAPEAETSSESESTAAVPEIPAASEADPPVLEPPAVDEPEATAPETCRYRVTGTDVMLDDRLLREGEIVELEPERAEGIRALVKVE